MSRRLQNLWSRVTPETHTHESESKDRPPRTTNARRKYQRSSRSGARSRWPGEPSELQVSTNTLAKRDAHRIRRTRRRPRRAERRRLGSVRRELSHRDSKWVAMRTIAGRLRRLEDARFGAASGPEGPTAAELIRERRRLRLQAEGKEPEQDAAPVSWFDERGRPRTIAEILRSRFRIGVPRGEVRAAPTCAIGVPR